jgi:uncharacterized membrane protein YfcA
MINQYNKYLLTILLGIFGGLIGGTLGIGISVALPGYIFLGIIDDIKTAMGTILLSSPLSWFAAYNYYKMGRSELILGIIFSVFYFIFAYFGSFINAVLTSKHLYSLTAITYFIFGFYFLYLTYYNKE